MPRYAIVIAATLLGSYAFLHGILMVVAPARHLRLLSWMGGRGTRREIFGSSPEPGVHLQRRLAGFGLAAIAIYIVFLVWKG
jgi:hypothetical protein